MKCPVCGNEMTKEDDGIQVEKGDFSIFEHYNCYNHDGGAVWLEISWRKYTKEELDYE